jgi:hypothetical protein
MALVTPSARSRHAAALLTLIALALVDHSRCAHAQEISGGYAPGFPHYVHGKSSDANCCGGGWLGVEYLRWRIDGGRDVPPLVTEGPATEPLDEVGQLDNPTTDILFGDEELNEDWRNGFRVYGGVWLDCCQCWGIGADYFDLDDDDHFISGSDPDVIVTRPFFNTETGEPDTQLVDVPDELWGEVEIDSSDDFSGAGIALQRQLWRCCNPCACGPSSQGYLLAGYRHYRYDSDLVITENLLVLPNTTTPLVPGTEIFVQDRFSTENDFHGAELGFAAAVQQSWWWIDGFAKVAFGSHRRRVSIDGETINTVPNAGTAEFEGGFLTSEVTNIGDYADDTLAVIPQLRLGVGGQLSKHFGVRAGYNVIFWNAVARAGSQLPPGLEVDPRNLPPVQPGGGDAPEFAGILGTPLIAHGLDLGVQFTY